MNRGDGEVVGVAVTVIIVNGGEVVEVGAEGVGLAVTVTIVNAGV